MYTFGIPVSVLSNTPPRNLVIVCYFCQVKIFKTPLSHEPERRFTAHELSIDLRLEAIQNWQHRNICSTIPYGRVEDNASVKASCASLCTSISQHFCFSYSISSSTLNESIPFGLPDCKPPSLFWSAANGSHVKRSRSSADVPKKE